MNFGEEAFFKKIGPGRYLFFSKGIFSKKGLIVTSGQKKLLLELTSNSIKKINYIILPAVVMSLYSMKLSLLIFSSLAVIIFFFMENERKKILGKCDCQVDPSWGTLPMIKKRARNYSIIDITKILLAFLAACSLLCVFIYFQYSQFGLFDRIFTGSFLGLSFLGLIYSFILLWFKFFRL